MEKWTICLISFIFGFISAYFVIYNIDQEDEEYSVKVDSYYEFCNNEFYIEDYITKPFNSFKLEEFITDIKEYCID